MKEPCSMWGVDCLSSYSIWYLFFVWCEHRTGLLRWPIISLPTSHPCWTPLHSSLGTSLGTEEHVLVNRVLDGWRKQHTVGTSPIPLLVGFTSPCWDADSSQTWETSAHADVGLYINGCCFSRVSFRRWAEPGKGRESECFWEWDQKKRTLWWSKVSQALGSSFAILVTLDKQF